MTSPPPPRLHVLLAAAAPVAVVFARTRGWVHVARWDLARGEVAPGAWFHGTVYARRSALSPDGAFLYVFGLKRGRPFHAVSRAPWLTALAYWRGFSTYEGGAAFVSRAARTAAAPVLEGPPDAGDLGPLGRKHGLRLVAPAHPRYGALLGAGWVEDARSGPRVDPWDERRRLVLTRPLAGGRLVLDCPGYVAGGLEGRAPAYAVEWADGGVDPLPGVVWADAWSGPDGDALLVATAAGALEVRDPRGGALRWRHDLTGLAPDPAPPPPHATRW